MATLSRKLTFVDVTCPGPGRARARAPSRGPPRAPAAAPSAAPGERSPRSPARSSRRPRGVHHHVFLKCWGAVDRLARPGAVVRFRGRMLRETNRRERDARSALPGSYDVSVPEGLCEVRTPAGASDVANAAPALRRLREADAEAAAAANASASPSRRRFRPPIETTSARGSVEGLGSRVGRVAVGAPGKSMLVAGACGDPSVARAPAAMRPPPELASASRASAARRRAARRGRATSTRTTRTRSRRRRGSGSAIASSRIGSWRRSASRAPTRARRRPSSEQRRGRRTRAFVVGDVAGGGGALSRELHVRHGLSVLMVDPRQVRSSPRVMRETRGLRKEAARARGAPPAWRRWRRAEGVSRRRARRRGEKAREPLQARPKKHRRRRGGRSERRRGRGRGPKSPGQSKRFGRRF